MTDPKDPADVKNPAAAPDAPSPVSPPRDPDELSDEDLDAVSGGMVQRSVNDYSSTDYLQA